MPIPSSPARAPSKTQGPAVRPGRVSNHGNGGSVESNAQAVVAEEVEILHASIKAGTIAQIIVAIIAAIGLIYLLKLVLSTIFIAVLLAFLVDPLVTQLSRIHIPRSVAALIAVLVLIVLASGLTYFFYSRAVDFATELPRYSGRIHSAIADLREQASKIEQSTRSVIASPKAEKKPVPVEIQETPGLSRVISAGSGTLGEVVLAVSFVPFLVYFMLTWKEHAHATTVQIFPKEHRLVAHRTVGRISEMIRMFLAGNVFVGLINAVVSGLVFWRLGIPYFYFLGAISGFVSLIPYLGVFLALLPPLAGGIGLLSKSGVIVVLATVIGLHVVTTNVLFPKIVGRRLRLNPLAVTLALFFWAWIWGAMGLILAVPLVGATKIICDYVDSLRGVGAWLGD